MRSTHEQVTGARRKHRMGRQLAALAGALSLGAGASALVTVAVAPAASAAARQHVAPAAHPAPHQGAHAVRPALAPSAPDLGTPVETFTVNTTNDTHQAAGKLGSGSCADTQGNCSLRAAVEEANAEGSSATPPAGPIAIVVPAGTYQLTLGTALVVTDPRGVEITGAGAGATVVSNAGHGDRVLDVAHSATSAAGAVVAVSALTLTGGTAPLTTTVVSPTVHPMARLGGDVAVIDPNDSLSLTAVTVATGTAATTGGGIANDGNLWVTGSTVTANHAGREGGGLANIYGAAQLSNDTVTANVAGGPGYSYGGGVAVVDGPVGIVGGSITHNQSLAASNDYTEGGGLYADDQTTVNGVAITANTAGPATGATGTEAYGGGIAATYGLSTISGSIIATNTVSATTTYAEGGGLYVNDGTQVTGTTISANRAVATSTGRGLGGGIFNESTLVAMNDTVAANAAVNGTGGGIANTGSTMTLRTVSITGNSASAPAGTFTSRGAGGGVASYDVSTASGVTLSGNSAANVGGGVYFEAGATWAASTISHNTAVLGGGVYTNEESVVFTTLAVVDNTAAGPTNAGGGIYLAQILRDASPHLLLTASTVAGNVSAAGAGLYSQAGQTTGRPGAGGAVLHADTIAANRMPTGSEQDCLFGTGAGMPPAPFTSQGGNVVGDTTCGLTGRTDRQGTTAQGYWTVAKDGGVFTHNAGFFGSMGGHHLNAPIVGMAPTPGNQGYWLAASDGGIFTFGDAGYFGSMGGSHLNAPIVGMAATPTGGGYWEVASDGGIFTFGNAAFFGSMGGSHLNAPIVGMAATPDGRGYWLVASDGGIFTFGDAGYYGSEGTHHLNQPIVGMARTTDGGGYWLVAADGGIFTLGDAGFAGSEGTHHLNAPVVAMAGTPTAGGYWEMAADGGVFTHGSAVFQGPTSLPKLSAPVVGGAAT